jgi:hypothetical protein
MKSLPTRHDWLHAAAKQRSLAIWALAVAVVYVLIIVLVY